jgi:hypothetical protein
VLSNHTIAENYVRDDMIRYINEHQKILDNNITLLIFVGQFDGLDGAYGVQEWMKKLKWDGMKDFYDGSRNLYYYQSDDNKEIRLGGNFKKHENLNVLMVYAAGHMVPATQLAMSRSMLSDIIYEGGLQCHSESGDCNLDTKSCSFMNNCTNNGECVTGKCHCNIGFHGADCSVHTKKLNTETLTLNATGWAFYHINDPVGNIKLTAQSKTTEFYLYTRKGDIPSQSFSDWLLKGTQIDIILSRETSGEYIAIFNPDFDHSIQIKLDVATKSITESTFFWIAITLGVLVVIFTAIFIAFFWRLRIIKKRSQEYTNQINESG